MEENGVHSPDVNVGPQEPEEKEDSLLEISIRKTLKTLDILASVFFS